VGFVCYICHAEKSRDFVHKHHKVPKSLGGSDAPDNLLDLCSGCHADMHTLARMMKNPKRVGEVRTALQSMFPDGGMQGRCLELATLANRSTVMSAEQQVVDEEREIQVGLKLKKPYRDALQLIARDRKLSMANYTRKIIEDHIRRVYPNVEKI
jgi:hypothetical protein